MRNIKSAIKGTILTLTIDLSAETKPSKSGSSNVVATTAGNVAVEGTEGLKLGLNAYFPVAA